MINPTSMLLIGDSSTGKTGSLISLIKAGYRIRLLDFENGSRILSRLISRQCPDKKDNFIVEKISTKYRLTSTGAQPEQAPKGLTHTGRVIDRWVKEAAPEDFIVLDSLTAFGRLCLVWSQAQNPAVRDIRVHVRNAQQVIVPIIATLTGDTFPCNTIIITHIEYRSVVTDDKGRESYKRSFGEIAGSKGYPASVGEALHLQIATFFNEVFRYKTIGAGKSAKRVIITQPDGEVDIKNTAFLDLKPQYNVDTGLAEIFATIKD